MRVNTKRDLIKRQLNKISNMIETALNNGSLLKISEICEEIGVSNVVTLKKHLKVLDTYIYERLQLLCVRNFGEHRRTHTDKDIDYVCTLSKEGKGIDTIEIITGIDKSLVVLYLKKRLGLEEYSRRHPKGRAGGPFARRLVSPNGDAVYSLKEYKLAEIFTSAGIKYTTQKEIPYIVDSSGREAIKYVDFYLPDYDLHIEYSGMLSFKFYREQVYYKDSLYKKFGIKYLFLSSIKEAKSLVSFLIKHRNEQEINDKIFSLSLPLSKDKVFHTIQGEGRSMGKPSVFVRLSYCNLSCAWCDSAYTWKSEYVNDKEKPVKISIIDLFNKIYNIQEGAVNCYRIIVTGGEPLLFQEALQYFVYYATVRGYKIEIETNGTIMPNYYMISFCNFNVSPKLSNNINDAKSKRIVPAAIKLFRNSKNASFKFVVMDSQADHAEIFEDYIEAFNIPRNKIWMMPGGQTSAELSKHRIDVMNLCINMGYNYSDRLQVVAFNDARGV